MPLPKQIFDPPFNIVRSSHIALGIADLGRSPAFYAETLGLIIDDHGSRHEPIRWSLRDPRRQTLWGQPARAPGLSPPLFEANVVVAD